MEEKLESADLEKEAGKVLEKQEPGEIETLATEIGWRPDGELDAKDYILKSRDIQDTMREHIKTQKKQLGELGSSVSELKTHNERVYKAEVSKLTTEVNMLKKEKRTAIEDGDADKVDELDEQIDWLKEAMVKPKETQANPDFNTWIEVDKNKWYTEDQEMADYADTIADQHKGAPFERVSALVEKKVKEMFPDKFPAKKSLPASPVEGAGKKIVVAKFTKADLTDSQKDIMNKFVKQGIMTEKDYIRDIAIQQGQA